MPKKMYTTEFKMEVVQKYLLGTIGAKKLAEQYHIGSKADILKWASAYQEHGIIGLCTKHGTYSGDFKVSVIKYMHNTGASIRETTAHFNIPSPQTVRSWERLYYEEGEEALREERRGRVSKVGIKRPRKTKNNVKENGDLLAEVQRLRMENEYLKKLNALIQEREKLEKPTK